MVKFFMNNHTKMKKFHLKKYQNKIQSKINKIILKETISKTLNQIK